MGVSKQQCGYTTEAEGGHPFLLRNFIFYFEVFQNYSNSTFYPSMEHLTTKILYPHPNRKHVAHSILRDSSRCSLYLCSSMK